MEAMSGFYLPPRTLGANETETLGSPGETSGSAGMKGDRISGSYNSFTSLMMDLFTNDDACFTSQNYA